MFPLRLNQEHFLFTSALAKREGFAQHPFRFVGAIRLVGAVDGSALEEALNLVVANHDGLQMAISHNAHLDQRGCDLELNAFARTGLFVPERYTQARIQCRRITLPQLLFESPSHEAVCQAVDEDASTEFDYSSPPFIRARLIRLDPSTHLLVLVVSHLVADLWSLNVVRDDLVCMYRALMLGTPVDLGHSTLTAPVFVLWEREQLRRGLFDTAIAYWSERWLRFHKDQLRTYDFADHVARGEGIGLAGTHSLSIAGDVAARLKRTAAYNRFTLYVLFRLAVAIGLHWLTGKARIVIGGNYANRLHPNVERCVGWLNNGHYSVTDFSSEVTARELLTQTRTQVIEALTHQALPLIALWNKLGRRLNFDPQLVLVTFDYHSELRRPLDNIGGTIVHPIAPLDLRWSRQDLSIQVVDALGEFSILTTYATNRFAASTIHSLSACVRETAIHIMDDLNAPLWRVRRSLCSLIGNEMP
jgi:hypothetical protein